MKLFVAGATARTAADLVGVNRHTATLFFRKLREKIAEHQTHELPMHGEIEIDESYFGGRRKGKRGRGASGRFPVFGILKRKGKVFTCMVEDAKRKTLVPIIKEKIHPDSIVYSDTWGGYTTLNVEGYRHVRINHQKEFVRKKKNHINGIENFWNQAKRHLRKFNGIPKDRFNLFLKECEWRFNGGNPQQLLKSLRKILNSS